MGLVTLIFDLETGVRVASKVANLASKFGHARPLGSRIIRYVRDGRTDRRMDRPTNAMLIAPFSMDGGISLVSKQARNCSCRPGWMDSRDTNTSVSGCTSTEDTSVLANDDDVVSVAAAAGFVI